MKFKHLLTKKSILILTIILLTFTLIITGIKSNTTNIAGYEITDFADNL